MTKRCSNCGCILEGGICSNCQEELFIIKFQSDDMVQPLSQEFIDKAAQQQKEVGNGVNE